MPRPDVKTPHEHNSVIQKPLNVHFYLIPNCNLTCNHCYYDAWPVTKRKSTILSADKVGWVIKLICDHWHADFHVEGGEIFLRQDLPEIINSIPEHYWKAVTLTTNGTVPIKLSASQLALFGNLRISVESHMDALQQEIRGVPLKPVLRTCETLSAKGLPYEIRVTLTRKNINQLQTLVQFFVNLGATRLSFYEFQPVGRGRDSAKRYALDEMDFIRMLEIISTLNISGLEHLAFSFPPKRSASIRHYESALTSSYKIIDIGAMPSLTINSDGTVGVCPWKVTADTVTDKFSHIDDIDFIATIATRLIDDTLHPQCKNCTEVQLRARTQTFLSKE